jgi:hypothetical protein
MRRMKSGSVLVRFACALSFSLSLSLSLNVMAASEGVHGGGDLCEDRIKLIRDDLKSWIYKGGAQSLSLPQGTSEVQYADLMLDEMRTARVVCVGAGDAGYPVAIGSTPKVCKFSTDPTGALITCDYVKFLATNESDQYVLIHHEYAGLAGIEVPHQDDSRYEVSNQISGYLEEQIVKKLVVRPGDQPELKVGSRVVVVDGPVGPRSAQITAVNPDQNSCQVRLYSDSGVLGDEQAIEKKFIQGSEVGSLKGVTKGQKAVCTHHHDAFDGTFEGALGGKVAHVYSNGFVEIDVFTRTANSHGYIPSSFLAPIFWSTVPGNETASGSGYTCSYF